MRRAVLDDRKRFAADLAERDRSRALSGPASIAVGSGTDIRRPAERLSIRVSAKPRAVTNHVAAEVLQAYQMRRWWLDRYSLDEIRELAGCLR